MPGGLWGGVDYGGNSFNGNFAWEEMTVTGDTVTDNSEKDGEGISKGAVKDGSGLPGSLKTNPPWIYEEGKLPILKDLEGQDGTLPDHLE
jgi:hypothetical protein